MKIKLFFVLFVLCLFVFISCEDELEDKESLILPTVEVAVRDTVEFGDTIIFNINVNSGSGVVGDFVLSESGVIAVDVDGVEWSGINVSEYFSFATPDVGYWASVRFLPKALGDVEYVFTVANSNGQVASVKKVVYVKAKEKLVAPMVEMAIIDTAFVQTGDTVSLAIKVIPGNVSVEKVGILNGDNYALDIFGDIWNGIAATGCKGYVNSTEVYLDTVRIKFPNEGAYQIGVIAYDENGFASDSVAQTIVVSLPKKFSETATEYLNRKIYSLSADPSANSSAFSCTSGAVYSIATVSNAMLDSKIDFIYFNYMNTFTMYSPEALDGLGLTTVSSVQLISQWSVKSSTTFIDVTGNVDFDTVKEDKVVELANNATATSILNLTIGDVVAFKTTAGQIGLFKVNNVTLGFGSLDYINIDLLVK